MLAVAKWSVAPLVESSVDNLTRDHFALYYVPEAPLVIPGSIYCVFKRIHTASIYSINILFSINLLSSVTLIRGDRVQRG